MSDDEIEARLRRLFAALRASAAETEAAERVGDVAAAVAGATVMPRVRHRGWLVATAVTVVVVPAGVVAVTLAIRIGAPSPAGSTGATGATASGVPGAALPAQPGAPIVASRAPSPASSASSTPDSTTSLSPSQVRMIDEVHGWAVTGAEQQAGSSVPGRVFLTDDGGRSWTDVTPRLVTAGGAAAANVETMAARTTDDAWVVATDSGDTASAIFHTTDGGRSWTRAAVGEKGGTVTPVSDHVAYYVEHRREIPGSDAVALWRTEDAGTTWRLVSRSGTGSGVPLACDKSDVGWRDPANGWMGGACPFGGIVFEVTHDGGMHWAAQRFIVPPGVNATGMGFSIEQPVFLTANDGYADATQFATGSTTSYLCATHDAGTTWTCSVAPSGAEAVDMVGTGHAVAFLTDGTIESSGDDGRHWTVVARHSEIAVGSVVAQFLDPDHGFLLFFPNSHGPARPAYLYRTDDGGVTLTRP